MDRDTSLLASSAAAPFRWLTGRRRTGDTGNTGDSEAPGVPQSPDLEARTNFHRSTVRHFHDLLKGAVRAMQAKPEDQEREVEALDALGESLANEPRGGSIRAYRRLEDRVSADCRRLSDWIDRQRSAMLAREQELSEVVEILTQSMAEATNENATLYEDIRAEGERIAEASTGDDLVKLRRVLHEATERLNSVVDSKESRDQSRIDALSTQVEALKSELEAVRRKASTDPLTQQLNRQAFVEILSSLIKRSRGRRRSFVLILFDIDDFKSINDRYGHQIGDRALLAFATYCRAQLRPDDSFARIGGEEFAALLEGASLRNAMKRAARICEGIAAQRYSIDDHSAGATLTLTASAGVAAFRKEDTDATLFKRADEALYQAKASGKNRAVAERAA